MWEAKGQGAFLREDTINSVNLKIGTSDTEIYYLVTDMVKRKLNDR